MSSLCPLWLRRDSIPVKRGCGAAGLMWSGLARANWAAVLKLLFSWLRSCCPAALSPSSMCRRCSAALLPSIPSPGGYTHFHNLKHRHSGQRHMSPPRPQGLTGCGLLHLNIPWPPHDGNHHSLNLVLFQCPIVTCPQHPSSQLLPATRCCCTPHAHPLEPASKPPACRVPHLGPQHLSFRGCTRLGQ